MELEAVGTNKDYAYIKEVQALSDEFTKRFDEILELQALSDEFTKRFDEILREQSPTMIQDTRELILLLLKDLAKITESR